jgi:superfamily II DNA or RNA helicase
MSGDNREQIAVGDKVRVGAEIGEVTRVEDHGPAKEYRVYFEKSGLRTFFSPPTVLEKIKDPLTKLKNLEFDPPYKFDLLTRATQLSLAFEYDHLLSLSNSRTNLEPYQVECVHKVINSFQQRFLIADDVGLGKTIEAAMILKELAARDRAKRVLIIAPASLTIQWRRELREKFDEHFWIYNSEMIRELKKTIPKDMNVWDYENKIITSVDFAKQEHVLAALERTRWDLIIFDEAHKLSVDPDGTQTQRYKLAKTLWDKTESILLLSATPHKGDRMAFWRLIQLLDPYLFKDKDHIEPEKLNTVMVRRGKDRLINEDGSKVFRPRYVQSVPVTFTEEEMALYRAVTDYVREEYNLARGMQNKAYGFAMVILQKRMVSSIYALKKSLQNRLYNFKNLKQETLSEDELKKYEDFLRDPDSLEDSEREVLERKLESSAIPLDPKGREIEIKKLEQLINLAERIKTDSKAAALRRFVDKLFKNSPEEKLLIFTEYRDTLDYLRDKILADYKDKLTEIHGEVPMEVRQEREKLFKNDLKIMLATDAAGEGINLQFCHIMVNYELPWNPNRLDQRIGRLHRYGQKKDVHVHNLLVRDTREGEIFIRLQEKVTQIEKDLGGRLSEVLGNLTEDIKLEDLIVNALAENTPIEVTERDLIRALEERKQMVLQTEGLLLKLHKFDLGGALKIIKKSSEIAFSNRDIELFVRVFFATHEGRIEPTRYKDQYRLFPPLAVQVPKLVPARIERATFDKEIAKKIPADECDFIAFGHPLLEQIIYFCKDRDGQFGGGTTCKSVPSDTGITKPGILFNFKLSYLDGEGRTITENLMPVFVSCDGQTDVELAKRIPLLVDYQDRRIPIDTLRTLAEKANALHAMALQVTRQLAETYVKKVQEQRDREVAIRLEDATRYFTPRIRQEEQNIQDYKSRLFLGEDMKVAIASAQKRLEEYREEWEKRKQELELKRTVFVQGPDLLNCAIIIPEEVLSSLNRAS